MTKSEIEFAERQREKLVELLNGVQHYGTICTMSQMDDRYASITQVSNTEVAERLIAHGVTVQEWISVKDRLPVKESQAYEREWAEYPMYIVMIDQAFLPNALYFDWRDSFWFDFRDDGTINEYQVTHWMPLPEPPKEVQP